MRRGTKTQHYKNLEQHTPLCAMDCERGGTEECEIRAIRHTPSHEGNLFVRKKNTAQHIPLCAVHVCEGEGKQKACPPSLIPDGRRECVRCTSEHTPSRLTPFVGHPSQEGNLFVRKKEHCTTHSPLCGACVRGRGEAEGLPAIVDSRWQAGVCPLHE